MWNIIRKKIALRKPFPNTIEATKQAWVEEWRSIPVDITNALIEALPKKMRLCIEDGGGNHFHG